MKPEHLLNALGEIDSRHLEGILPRSPAEAAPLYELGSAANPTMPRPKNRFARRVAIAAVCALLCVTAVAVLFALPYFNGNPTLPSIDPFPSDTPSLVLPSSEMAPFAPLPAYEDAPYTMQELYTLLHGRTVKFGGYPIHDPYEVFSVSKDSIAALPAPLTGETAPIYRLHSLQYTEDVMNVLAKMSEPIIREVLKHKVTDTIEWKATDLQEYEVTENTPSYQVSPDGKLLDLYASVHSEYTYAYNENVPVSLRTYPGFYALNFYLKDAEQRDLTHPHLTAKDTNVFFFGDSDEDIYNIVCRSVQELTELMDIEITDYRITRHTWDNTGNMTVVLYGKEFSASPELDALDTYKNDWYSLSKRTAIVLSYETTSVTEKSTSLTSIEITHPVKKSDEETYTKEGELPLLSLSEAEYLLACGCVIKENTVRCRLCLADRSEVDMTDYDTVTMEYIRCPDEGLLIPCYVFWKHLYDEDGRSFFAKDTVPAIPVSGLEDFFSNDAEEHESFCISDPYQ